ncbi:MAG: NtrZ family periplasmic regulatory protein [Brevundimonas sp.]|uniref:NtrZ family periplasmic regulatory protein n=1 Tax=Brevundimonas sp. TaxID=1871086 RepID=UPI0039190FC8
MAAAAALIAASDDVAAQTRDSANASVQPSAAVRNDLVSGRDTPRRGLQWNEDGRWGLDLNLSQPVGREADWSDVQAGAYYRLNPRLRVGAAASLSEPQTDPARPVETDRRSQPRVRLETIFKF